jgi:hypothetical protein
MEALYTPGAESAPPLAAIVNRLEEMTTLRTS